MRATIPFVRRKSTTTAVLLASWWVMAPIALGQEADAKKENRKASGLTQVIDDLQEAIQNQDRAKARVLTDELKTHGNQAVLSIGSALALQRQLRATLVQTLGGIGGDVSTDALLTLAYQDPLGEIATDSISRLQNRPINRPLTENELQAFIGRLSIVNVVSAGQTARLLSRCSHNDARKRTTPIIARFKREVQNPTPMGRIRHSYISGHAFALNQFLLAFSQINDPVVVTMLSQEMKAQTNPNLRKWLTIALGFAGDGSVAPHLEQLVRAEKDASVRIVTLRAYALAAREKAIPLLETFLNDKTLTGRDISGPLFGLRIVAKDELTRLRAQKPAPTDGAR